MDIVTQLQEAIEQNAKLRWGTPQEQTKAGRTLVRVDLISGGFGVLGLHSGGDEKEGKKEFAVVRIDSGGFAVLASFGEERRRAFFANAGEAVKAAESAAREAMAADRRQPMQLPLADCVMPAAFCPGLDYGVHWAVRGMSGRVVMLPDGTSARVQERPDVSWTEDPEATEDECAADEVSLAMVIAAVRGA